MHNVAPVPGRDRQGRTFGLAFPSALLSLAAAFAAVGSTIPLFNVYRAQDGFTNAGISMTVVAYSAATISTLLVLGRLSNHVGRRPAALASLGLLVLGCLVLLNVHHIGVLIAGRILMGLGAGLASSSLTAYVVDTAPARPAWLASVASSQTVMLGLALGAVASGALVQFGPWPRDLVYLVSVGLLLLSMVLIAVSPDTVATVPGAWRSLKPTVRVPVRVRHLLAVTAAVLLSTWATGAFYQAFVPALVEDQLRTHSPLVLGLVFAAYMAPSALGAPLSGRFAPAGAQRIGMAAFVVGWTGIITAIATGALPLFIAATVVAGAGQGVAISGTTRGLLYASSLTDRAPIFAVVYLLSYSGATVPSLISGQLSHTFSLPKIALGYGAFALVATLFTVIAARDPHTDTAGQPSECSRRTLPSP
ncbi:putative MFS family arabinose efflux permease [Streptomyces sp. Ag109_O5-1]|uniref:MFS transporter n=1 Tax=Streptomyces sp. Ag109_O5-1 TaxID=1938851 RepID=UPI000F4E4384|nr:MFS transporter [Streptomyces sp. Ag109_O5-1]RPE37286.1 putative MFS family arabinose efflux permease [Streptomyces sp. Ag109_O5-1]